MNETDIAVSDVIPAFIIRLQSFCNKTNVGLISMPKTVFTGTGIPIIKIRWFARQSYIHNGNTYSGKTASLYWKSPSYIPNWCDQSWLHEKQNDLQTLWCCVLRSLGLETHRGSYLIESRDMSKQRDCMSDILRRFDIWHAGPQQCCTDVWWTSMLCRDSQF